MASGSKSNVLDSNSPARTPKASATAPKPPLAHIVTKLPAWLLIDRTVARTLEGMFWLSQAMLMGPHKSSKPLTVTQAANASPT